MISFDTFFTVLLIWNIVTFGLIAVDKGKAENDEFRISEKFFFISAFLFGGLGIFLGMHIFRHKTKHRSFQTLIPTSIILNIIGIVFILKTNLFS